MPRHHHRRAPDDLDDLPAVPLTGQGLRETAQLFRYLLPYRRKFAAALFALLLSSLLGLAFPAQAGRLVNAALHQEPGEAAAFLREVDTVAVSLAVVLAVQAAFSYFRALWLIEVGERSLADLRRDTY